LVIGDPLTAPSDPGDPTAPHLSRTFRLRIRLIVAASRADGVSMATGLVLAYKQNKNRFMTADHSDSILEELAIRQPFQIFTVELHGGRRFEVDHRRALIARDGVAVFLAPGGVPVLFDHDSVNQIIVAPASTSI
jgi:hypothetical protein